MLDRAGISVMSGMKYLYRFWNQYKGLDIGRYNIAILLRLTLAYMTFLWNEFPSNGFWSSDRRTDIQKVMHKSPAWIRTGGFNNIGNIGIVKIPGRKSVFLTYPPHFLIPEICQGIRLLQIDQSRLSQTRGDLRSTMICAKSPQVLKYIPYYYSKVFGRANT